MTGDPAIRAAAERVLAAHGIAVGALTALDGGWGGVNLRADTARGPLVVKVRHDPRKLAATRAVSAVLTARRVPHPTMVVPPTATAAGWLAAVEWVPGRSLDRVTLAAWSAAEIARFGADLGGWLRRLHAVRLGPAARRSWQDRAGRRLGDKLRRCVQDGLVDDGLAGRVAQFWAAGRDELRDVPVSIVHRDLQPGNLVADGRRFAGVIDFEQAWPADPCYDFVKLRQWVYPLHPAIESALEDAYGLDRADPRTATRLAVAAVLEHLSALVYFHQHGNAALGTDQRARLRTVLDSR
jgi:aminoglycoside phosphotransferase (APT) family kinase protein